MSTEGELYVDYRGYEDAKIRLILMHMSGITNPTQNR